MTRTTTLSRTALAMVSTAVGLSLAGCSLIGSGSEEGATNDEGDPTLVRVVTHDSFALSEDLIEDFEDETGYTLEFSAPGDGGALVNQLILTTDSPLGDVAYGVDNSFAGRAIAEGVFDPYTSPDLPTSAEPYLADEAGSLTPVDLGDVCLNVDHEYFTSHDLAEPETLDDLLEEQYQDLVVVTNPATSSPGLAFLLATVGAYGQDGWLDYWQELADNGLKVVESWSDAYSVDFSGSTGEGDRPIVLSYSTSPAFEVGEEDTEAPTSALLETCFRQVEYAGVLAGSDNPDGAQAFIDFLVSDEVQADIPEQMYMYPVNGEIDLPEAWTEFAPLAEDPFTVDTAVINDHRDEWIQQWTETVIG